MRTDGAPTEPPVTYEELQWYREAAEAKLAQYGKLVVDTYALILMAANDEDPATHLAAAKDLLTDFDKTVPRIQTQGPVVT